MSKYPHIWQRYLLLHHKILPSLAVSLVLTSALHCPLFTLFPIPLFLCVLVYLMASNPSASPSVPQAPLPTPAGYDDWSPEQKAFFHKYNGKLPKQNELLKRKDKKHFDSADWAKNINNKGRTFSQ